MKEKEFKNYLKGKDLTQQAYEKYCNAFYDDPFKHPEAKLKYKTYDEYKYKKIEERNNLYRLGLVNKDTYSIQPLPKNIDWENIRRGEAISISLSNYGQ